MKFSFVKKSIILLVSFTLLIIGTCSCGTDAAADYSELTGMYDSIRAAQVDIDSIYVEDDVEELDKNIDQLIEKLLAADINTVFLQAFSDDDGSGNIESVYFYTTHAPVKADVFDDIATRLKENGFKVIAWMHTLSCQWLFTDNPENKIMPLSEGEAGWYDRATPFNEETWNSLRGLFDDLSKHSNFDGILFQDDLYMNDYEDFSTYGKAAFKEKFHVDLDESLLANQDLQNNYSKFKTEILIDLTESLMKQVRENIPNAVSMRNIYSPLLTEPDSEEWFAQNYEDFINCYDYTVIMAYPYLEDDVHNPYQWMVEIVDKAIRYAGDENKQKIIVKIQTYNWNTESWLPDTEIESYLNLIDSLELHSAMYPQK